MVAFNFKMIVFITTLASMTFHSSAGILHKVGDDEGWIVPNNPSFYSDWQSKRSFKVGDILYFNFSTGSHDVAKVDEAGYDNCKPGDRRTIITDGPCPVNLTEGGDHWYICSFKGHCDQNQKLKVYVSEESTMTPLF